MRPKEAEILRQIRELRDTINKAKAGLTTSQKKTRDSTQAADFPDYLLELDSRKLLELNLMYAARLRLEELANDRRGSLLRSFNRRASYFAGLDFSGAQTGANLSRDILNQTNALAGEVTQIEQLYEIIFMRSIGKEPVFPLKRYTLGRSYTRIVAARKQLQREIALGKVITKEFPVDTWIDLENRFFGAKSGLVLRAGQQIFAFASGEERVKLTFQTHTEDVSQKERNLQAIAEFRGNSFEFEQVRIEEGQTDIDGFLAAFDIERDSALALDFKRFLLTTAFNVYEGALRVYLEKGAAVLESMWQRYLTLKAQESPRATRALTAVSNVMLSFYRRVVGERIGKMPYYEGDRLQRKDYRGLEELFRETAVGKALQDTLSALVDELNQRLSEIDIDELRVNSEHFNVFSIDFCDVCTADDRDLVACSLCKSAFFCEHCAETDFSEHAQVCIDERR